MDIHTQYTCVTCCVMQTKQGVDSAIHPLFMHKWHYASHTKPFCVCLCESFSIKIYFTVNRADPEQLRARGEILLVP